MDKPSGLSIHHYIYFILIKLHIFLNKAIIAISVRETHIITTYTIYLMEWNSEEQTNWKFPCYIFLHKHTILSQSRVYQKDDLKKKTPKNKLRILFLPHKEILTLKTIFKPMRRIRNFNFLLCFSSVYVIIYICERIWIYWLKGFAYDL